MSEVKRVMSTQTVDAGQALEIDLQVLFIDIYKGIRKFWWLVLLMGLVASGSYYYLEVKNYEPYYLASATFTVSTQTATNYGTAAYSFSYDGSVTKMTDTFPYILNSDILQQIIMEDLGVDSLNGDIDAKGVEFTNLFTLEVTSNDAGDAYDILVSAIKNYPKVAEFIIGGTQMNTLAPPSVSPQPINSISKKSTILKGFLLGAFCGFAFIFAYALVRKTIRKVDEIETKLNQISLGIIPHVRFKRRSSEKLQALTILNRFAGSAFQESIRALRTRILKIMDAGGAKVLLVTSTAPSEGKSTIALNLALSIAQKGSRVLLIDADMKRGQIQNLLNIKGKLDTFLDVMEGSVSLHHAVMSTHMENFCFLSCGYDPDHSVEVLSASAFQSAVDDLKKRMDYIIIDSPPCGMLADATVLSGICENALYVIKQDYAKVGKIIEGIQGIGYSGIKVAGCVLSDAKAGLQGYGYGYGYGHGYGSHYYGSSDGYGSYGGKDNHIST